MRAEGEREKEKWFVDLDKKRKRKHGEPIIAYSYYGNCHGIEL